MSARYYPERIGVRGPPALVRVLAFPSLPWNLGEGKGRLIESGRREGKVEKAFPRHLQSSHQGKPPFSQPPFPKAFPRHLQSSHQGKPCYLKLSVLPRSKDCLGKIANLEGNFWQRCSKEDKDKGFPCKVLDYESAHKYQEASEKSGAP